jgi:uncharacterized protein with PQ loop repeat
MDTLFGMLANTLICLVLLPQMIRLFKGKKARYLSIGLLLAMIPAALCWGAFGWLENKQLMIAFSTLTILLILLTLTLYINYKSHLRIIRK